jgi:hypothetical protein
MFDHLEHWKTYPAKSTFKPSDPAGDKGEKVFEQPLIAAQAGEQSIPALGFSYFNPNTQHYERAQTQPIKVLVASSLADSSLGAPAEGAQGPNGILASRAARGLRPDHPPPRSSVSELRPLYFQTTFLAVPAALALLLAGSLFAVRPHRGRVTSKATGRALAQLAAAARAGDPALFFEMARSALLQKFSAQWQLSADRITGDELKARLGTMSEDVERLFALADEAKYSGYDGSGTDFQHWLGVIRGQLLGERQ